LASVALTLGQVSGKRRPRRTWQPPPQVPALHAELVHDLVGLLGALESDQETRAVVLESADPDYFVPHVDLTKVAEYTAEAAKAGGPDDASLDMLWHKLSGAL
jgi:enoyl-CoA hydratase/carnithine racemase